MADSKKFAAVVGALVAAHKDLVAVAEKAMATEERMHAASLEAQKGLLHHALKGAENCSPEQFECLIGALERVTVAGIEAEKSVALAHAENGKAFIKALDGALESSITIGGQIASARLEQMDRQIQAEEVRAEAKAKAAKAELKKAEILKAEKLKKDFKASA